MVKLKVGEFMATIVQNGNVGGIIRNGILYGGVLSEGGEISETVRLTETEWNNLSVKDNNKIYYITNDNGDMIIYTYQGNRRILNYKNDISDYVFWYEDLKFPRDMISADYAKEYYWLDNNIMLNSTENLGRSWQLEFNVSPQTGSSSEKVVIGTDTSSDQNVEFYITGAGSLCLYGQGFNDDNCGNVVNKNVIVKFENNIITVTVDNILVITKNYTPTVDNNNYFVVANYRDYYCFNGYMNYIGFKWLSTPTPSGADGYTYDLSVDNNYTLNVVEYNNGTQTQTDSFTDSDLSNPVTFGDIIISYNIGADAFIIKPNYVDGKSVKLNNVLYSGNNEIEFISGETGLPSYAESQTYTLTGWIE